MKLKILLLASVAWAAAPLSAAAGGMGAFAGIDVYGGAAFGSSRTTDGGAPAAGGSIVGDIRFGLTAGFGGHIGYRFDPSTSVFISYQHVRGGIGWTADFPEYDLSSEFAGTAISNAVFGNVAYDHPLSDTIVLKGSLGLGMSLNTLSGVLESDAKNNGDPVAHVAAHSQFNPAARVGAGVQHRIGPNAVLNLDASLIYVGGFATGDTRSGNVGQYTAINPYRIDDVLRADLGASLRFQF